MDGKWETQNRQNLRPWSAPLEKIAFLVTWKKMSGKPSGLPRPAIYPHLTGWSAPTSLYGWALSLVKDPDLAEDITQATFITAYEKLSIFRGGSLRAWLFTIARNRSFDELRRMKRRPVLSLDNNPDDENERDLLSFLPGQDSRPEDIYEASEQAIMIERMMARLPAPFQQVLRLVDIDEMDYQEAAEILDLPIGTLKSRLARARLKMRELLVHSGYLS